MMHFYRNRADKSSILVEKIVNVSGSTAGAGSADYYAYRNRRRDVIEMLINRHWQNRTGMRRNSRRTKNRRCSKRLRIPRYYSC
jgi:hypothetical protein